MPAKSILAIIVVFIATCLFSAKPAVTLAQDEAPSGTDAAEGQPAGAEERFITFDCGGVTVRDRGGFELLGLDIGDTVSCTLTVLQRHTRNTAGRGLKISSEIRAGNSISVNAEPAEGVTDDNGELTITLTAIDRGIDWLAWNIADKDGDMRFDKEAYDSGRAWGMFVLVK